MSLAFTKETYERFGREDPMFAVLSDKRFQGNRWDPAEFFRTGEEEIAKVLEYVESQGISPHRGRALDFGCGVGRLSQALARDFDEVIGVDIAQSMVEHARKWNAHGDRVQYRVNSEDHLKQFDDASFDFVYSNITLQHAPHEAACRYIAEFVRVLRPGGVGVFQVPSGRPWRPGSFGAWLYRVRRHHLRRFWRAIRGKPPVEIHYVPRVQVEQILREAGAKIVDVVDVHRRKRGKNFRYCFTR